MEDAPTDFTWLKSGEEAFPRMLQAIQAAQRSVELETYTFRESSLGERVREALVAAAQRGVQVRLVIDFIGSRALRTSFWDPLLAAGGAFRWFNPWNAWRMGFRDHRKILVTDRTTAFIGGFNIAPEYEGDGVRNGWRDLGLEIKGPLAAILSDCVMHSFTRADFKHKRLQSFRRSPFNQRIARQNWRLLLSGPGRGPRHLKRTLLHDLKTARTIRIAAAYFLPTWKIRRALVRAARRGARVQLVLAGRSDIALTQMATRCLYHRLLRAGVEISEYQPQVLHTKLIILDEHVYAGSANLDARSLNINYELLLRVTEPRLLHEARKIFYDLLSFSVTVEPGMWTSRRPFWKRWLERWAYLLLARLDPYLARLHARDIP